MFVPPAAKPAPKAETVEIFDFSEALARLKGGALVARHGWNGEGMFVYLVRHSANMTLPYLAVFTAPGTVPWLASQTDLLADDWMEV